MFYLGLGLMVGSIIGYFFRGSMADTVEENHRRQEKLLESIIDSQKEKIARLEKANSYKF